MTDSGKAAEPQSSSRGTLGRLYAARWLLAASGLALIGVNAFAGGPWLAVVPAFLVVLLAAALAPIRAASARASGAPQPPPGSAGLEGLSARGLAAAVSDPLIIFNEGGDLVHANAAAAVAFGSLAAGTSIELKFRAPEMLDLIRRVIDTETQSASADFVERVPVERVYRVDATPIDRERGLFVLIFRDQSEARRIDRMRADFIANASHELRTPLASIAGFIETLRGPARNDAKARESFLQIMQAQTGRMARLIDDLLSLSRIEMKPRVRPGAGVDLRDVVNGVIDALGHLARESGVTIERLMPDGPATVAGDRDELIQVFENLLENAIKYGQSGGRVDVEIERRAGGETVVTVRDYGAGIAEEHIPRITERFYRVDVETSRAQKGTGLGLSIVKHILTRHDARLTIRSELGKGATFAVHFPADRTFAG